MPSDIVLLLVSAAIRAFGLGLVAVVGLFLFRIRSSAARHATWTIVLIGMLLQIPLGVVTPAILITALRTPAPPVPERLRKSPRPSMSAAQALAPASHPRTEPNGRFVWSSVTLTGAYIAISMLLFVRVAHGCWLLRRILRHAEPIPSLGPGIFESRLFVVPVSVGWFRPRILLPPTWRNWKALKLRAVLEHERAHIRRRDWIVRVASRVDICIFWFHPLAWWMERELARLAEEACDDVALSQMEDRDEYAATLVDMAHAAAAHRGVLSSGVVSMANDSNVTQRVTRILSRRLEVSKPLGRLAWATLFACSLPVIYLSAAVKLTSASRHLMVADRAVVPVRPAEWARQPMSPEQNPPRRLIAQAAPNKLLRPAPPLTPAPREDPPITMCILIDNSGSMRNRRAGVTAAILPLVKASKPHDEVCILHFNDETFSGLPYGEDFTNDIKKMEEAITYIDSRGGKAMRDAVRNSIEQIEQSAHHDRKVLVLVTEGNDTSSSVTQDELLDKLRNSDVRVYSIGLLSEEPRRAGAARLALGQLAEASGGLDHYPKNLAEVERISPKIANEVRKQ